MNKNIWRKIKDCGVLEATDLTADEKKILYAVMAKYGMPQSSCYRRFFEKGFDNWEIDGISKIKNEFLLSVPCETDNEKDGEAGTRGYGYVLSLMPDYDESKFYQLVTQLKIGVSLIDFMAQRGMASQMTVRTRFKASDWKSWENVGIAYILDKDLSDIKTSGEN